jgi:ribosome maturation factor RimP
VSRAVTGVLDARDTELFGDTPYVLEVTSPGVDRPLTEPRHWRRAVGRLVEVPVGGTPTRARVVAADDVGVELAAEAGARSRHDWTELGRGTVQIEFGRAEAEDDGDDELDAEEEES